MKNNPFSVIFWKGILAILPVYITLYFIYWLITSIERNVSQLMTFWIGAWYFPGLGLLITILMIYAVGILMQLYIGSYIVNLFQRLVQKIPFIGDLYSSIHSLTKYLSKSDKIKGHKAVMVNVQGIEVLGVLTRTDFSNAPKGVVEKDNMISVYIPMSYQIGGFTLYVPKETIRQVDMDQKEALKWALIGGIET